MANGDSKSSLDGTLVSGDGSPASGAPAPEAPPPPSRRWEPKRRQNGWRAVGRWAKRVAIAAFLLAVVGMIVLASLPKPVPVDVVEAQEGAFEVTVDEDGRARVKDRYVVSAPLGGNLARIELDPGDAIEQGQVLARIVPLASPLLDERSRQGAEARVAASVAARKQARAQIERAKAALSFAEKDAQQQRELAERGSTPEQALDRALLEERSRKAELTSAEFGARVADYELQMARAALGHIQGDDQGEDQLEVPSPVTGRVLRVIQQSEGAVQAGTPLLEVGDPAALEIVVDVLTSDAVDIQPSAPVHIERWGGEPLEAVVRLVEPSAFTRVSSLGVEEQRVNAIIDLRSPRPKWTALGDGYRVEARIVTWQAERVLKVPANAAFRHAEGWAVFVVDDDVARLRPVELGKRSGVELQIAAGLEKGERVVTHPSDRVADGVKVAVR